MEYINQNSGSYLESVKIETENAYSEMEKQSVYVHVYIYPHTQGITISTVFKLARLTTKSKLIEK